MCECVSHMQWWKPVRRPEGVTYMAPINDMSITHIQLSVRSSMRVRTRMQMGTGVSEHRAGSPVFTHTLQGLVAGEEHPTNKGVIVVPHAHLLDFLQRMTRDGVRIRALSMQGYILNQRMPTELP